MDPQSVRTTYQDRLSPTPNDPEARAGAGDHPVALLHALQRSARRTQDRLGALCGVALTYHDQANELANWKRACPEYVEVHSQVRFGTAALWDMRREAGFIACSAVARTMRRDTALA